eukprot:jgi/Tetstr1/439827/TSEL_028238.t1
MVRVQSSTPGGGVEWQFWQFRCCDGGCGHTYQRLGPLGPLCTTLKPVNHGMESDDPAAAEGGADAAAGGVPPAVVSARRRAAKLTAVLELRRARQALDTADFGMVSDAPLRRSLS